MKVVQLATDYYVAFEQLYSGSDIIHTENVISVQNEVSHRAQSPR